jgi:DNA-binding NtrC family response regulator
MKRVLIIDDDPSIQLLYQEELSEEGYDVISSDGEKGLLQLIADKRPDLMLLDIRLRSRNGLDLVQDIRNAFERMPVILTTAYPAFELDPKSVAADAYVTKNSDLTELKQQIGKCLNPPRPLAEKQIILSKTAQARAIEPAVQLSLRLNK